MEAGVVTTVGTDGLVDPPCCCCPIDDDVVGDDDPAVLAAAVRITGAIAVGGLDTDGDGSLLAADGFGCFTKWVAEIVTITPITTIAASAAMNTVAPPRRDDDPMTDESRTPEDEIETATCWPVACCG
jgi:hypothetical protein